MFCFCCCFFKKPGRDSTSVRPEVHYLPGICAGPAVQERLGCHHGRQPGKVVPGGSERPGSSPFVCPKLAVVLSKLR